MRLIPWVLATAAVLPCQDVAPETGLGFSTLKNGLRYRCVEVPGCRGVCFALGILVGADHDPRGKTGLATAAAELIRATQRELPEQERLQVAVRGPLTLVRTVLKGEATDQGLQRVARLLSWPKGEIDADMAAKALAKARLFADDQARIYPGSILYLLAKRRLLQGTPAGRQTVGIPAEMAALDGAFLRSRLRAYYRPRNALLVVLGGRTAEDLGRRIERILGPLAPGPSPAPPATVHDDLGAPPSEAVGERVRAPFVSAGLRAPPVEDKGYLSFLVAMSVLQSRAVLALGQPRGREAAARFYPFFYNFAEGSRVVLVNRRAHDGEAASGPRQELAKLFAYIEDRGATASEIARAAAATAVRLSLPPYAPRLVSAMASAPRLLYTPATNLLMAKVLGWSGDLADRIGALSPAQVQQALLEAVRPENIHYFSLLPAARRAGSRGK